MAALSRLQFEDLDESVRVRLEPRVKRLGYLGEFFRCAAHQPAALAAFIDFTESSKGGLPERLVEVLALTCAGWMKNDYEKHQHERLAVRLGFGREWVAEVNRLSPGLADLADDERLVQQLALSILETQGRGSQALFSEAVDLLGEGGAVALLMVIGRYVTHALIVNTLGLAPPVPSIFTDGFVG